MGNKNIILLGLLTILAFPIIGYVIEFYFSENSFWLIFKTKKGLLYEIPLGLFAGTVIGFIAWKINNLKFLLPVKTKYQGVIRSFKMNLLTIIIISICAGVGEEILFRGVLQTYFGIWITAILFVAIHGYLNPIDWRISLYGIFMTLSISLIGYLHQIFGLTTAMLAHTMIDVILLIKLTAPSPDDSKQHVIT